MKCVDISLVVVILILSSLIQAKGYPLNSTSDDRNGGSNTNISSKDIVAEQSATVGPEGFHRTGTYIGGGVGGTVGFILIVAILWWWCLGCVCCPCRLCWINRINLFLSTTDEVFYFLFVTKVYCPRSSIVFEQFAKQMKVHVLPSFFYGRLTCFHKLYIVSNPFILWNLQKCLNKEFSFNRELTSQWGIWGWGDTDLLNPYDQWNRRERKERTHTCPKSEIAKTITLNRSDVNSAYLFDEDKFSSLLPLPRK